LPGEPYFFEILIYLGPPEDQRKFLERKRSRWIAPLEKVKDFYPRTYRGALKKFDRDFGHPPKFNDVVGGIGLFACGERVCGNLYFTATKRIQRRGRHRVVECGELFETECLEDMTSEEIFESVSFQLHAAFEHPMLSRRWIDLEPFRRTGPLLDWHTLLGAEKATARPPSSPSPRLTLEE